MLNYSAYGMCALFASCFFEIPLSLSFILLLLYPVVVVVVTLFIFIIILSVVRVVVRAVDTKTCMYLNNAE